MKVDRLDSFYSELADLLSAGITLPEAVEKTLSGSDTNLQAVRQRLEAGDLEPALRRLGLPERDSRILAAGHRAGQLPQICRHLSSLYRMWQEMAQKVALAGGYFFIVGVGLCVALAVILFLLLDWRLALLVGFSALLGWSYGAWSLYRAFKGLIKEEGISRFRSILFSLPLFSSLHQSLQYYLIYNQWFMLYGAGVSIDRIFQSLARSFKNYRGELQLVAGNLEKGESLSGIDFLQEIFPPADYRQIASGEQSGKLEETLRRLAEDHRAEVEKIVDRMPGYLLLGFYLLFVPLVLLVVLYFFRTYFAVLSEITAP